MTPAHDLILYLLLDLGLERARRKCAKYELLMPSPSYVDALAEDHPPPAGFRLGNSRHQPSIDFLCRLGIEQLARGGPEVRDSFSLLGRPRMRERVEAWAIAGADTALLTRALENRGWSPAPGTIDCYLAHFFDVSRVTRAQLRKLTRHLHDARARAARLPTGQSAILSTDLEMGGSVPRLDLHGLLSQTRNILALRTLEAAAGSARNARAAERYAVALEKVVDTIGKITDPVEEVQRQLSQLRLRTDGVPFRLLSDFGEGVSTSLVRDEVGPGDLPLELDE